MAKPDLFFALSTVAFVLAGLLFAAAVVLFIVLKIPKVIDYFTNRSAKKHIRQTTAARPGTQGAPFRPDGLRPAPAGQTAAPGAAAPAPAGQAPLRAQPAPNIRPETGLLQGGAPETGPAPGQTVNLAEQTALLTAEGTEVLAETVARAEAQRPRVELRVLERVVLIHTDEVIA